MRALVLIIASLLLAVLPLGAVAAHYMPAGNPTCNVADPVHAYIPFSPAASTSSALERRTGIASVGDGNLADCDGDGIPYDFDGDIEFGNGGTAHPVVSDLYGDRAAACGWASSHHDATFTLADHSGATVAFVVASDATRIDEDPTTPAIEGCSTDNIISQTLDPNDCIAPVAVTPAAIGFPTEGTCAGGWDGLTWVFVLEGVVEQSGFVVLSLPSYGDTW